MHALMKLGRRPRNRLLRAPRMYHLGVALPAAAPMARWDRQVQPTSAWGMDCNDKWGCCTIAGSHHIQVVDRACAHTPILEMSEAETLENYRKVNPGFDPTTPATDTGAMLSDVMQVWRDVGFEFGGSLDRIDEFLLIEPQETNNIRLASQWFGGLSAGVDLPLTAQTQTIWDVADGPDAERGSWGAHCVGVVGYDQQYLYLSTWGAVKQAAWAWWEKYGDEIWVPLSEDWLRTTGVAPNGFSLVTLRQNFALEVGAAA